MANHIHNKIVFDCSNYDRRNIKNIKRAIGNSDKLLDFSVIIPQPEDINLKTSDKTLWDIYDWNVKNWGTKLNAYEVKRIHENKNYLEITFTTAWTPPYPILNKIFEFKNVDIKYYAITDEHEVIKNEYYQNGKRMNFGCVN